jgi:hypothetical protein
MYYLEPLHASKGMFIHWSRLHLQSLAPTNPHWARSPYVLSIRKADDEIITYVVHFRCTRRKPSIEWSPLPGAETERSEAERAAILQLESHLAAASNAKLPVTEHSSRLLSQVCSSTTAPC